MILLDTHVVIWLALSPERISPAAAAAIRQAASTGEIPGISVLTLYEISDAIRRGRIKTVTPHRVFLDRLKGRFRVIPVSEAIAVHAAELVEPFHGDAIDRIIAATAIVEKCTLISADSRIHAANACTVLW